ncbi:formate dehydrogenase accessory sulfurtransferase FdhD [Rubricoccus marinus]|uniref:Sulfur carrier protein FdhD n=1 Tax=Rubricoccus marinus TaxID=716817 RepID=A0A259U1W0_9BACT|nr:formate dehydrogenase accessory sulfurtransferase FdhD [Rubricoccus marinus]OZC03951.1 formate dehydrogenase family accessory protein FdhD [Rubricoccus marinus]
MPLLSTSGARALPVVRVRGGQAETADDWLAAEEPLEIRLMWGDRVQRLAVTMRTPGHDADLAVGFLVGEGVIRSPEDVLDAFHAPIQGGQTDPNIVAVRLASGVTFDAGRLERHVYTTSSCGVCGKASLEAVGVITGAPLAPGPRLTPEAIHAMPALLREAQDVFEQTGGLHAAALFSVSGGGASCDLLRVREDVGRHNAVDKLVGSYFASGETVPPQAVVLVSGRASFELAQKALVAGISVLAAVGAPSSLAADLAREHGMTLLGFVRDGRFNVYAGAERLDLSASGDR